LSKEAKAYRKNVEAAWFAKTLGRWRPLEGPLAIRLNFTFPDHREHNLDNLKKGVWDALEHCGAFLNDNQIRLDISEGMDTVAPGWVDVTLGVKPGEVQGTLFETPW
jgi:Holliday junction resolvase RusA-like endonuclease